MTTEAAIDANAPLADDFQDPSGPVDSDDEKDLIMAAIARSRPKPLAQHIFVPVRRKYAYVRMKEMLGHALMGSKGSIFGSAAAAAAAVEAPAPQPSGAAGASAGGGAAPVMTIEQERRASMLAAASGVAPPNRTGSTGGGGGGGGGMGMPQRKASQSSVMA
jgi:hypothetical protein